MPACNDSCPFLDPVCCRGSSARGRRIGWRWAQHQQRRCANELGNRTHDFFTLVTLRGRAQAQRVEGRAQAQRVEGRAQAQRVEGGVQAQQAQGGRAGLIHIISGQVAACGQVEPQTVQVRATRRLDGNVHFA